ncbi:unnamed protein product, partial [Phaeothamnion confervicola]
IEFLLPAEITLSVAARCRTRRLALALSREELAARSGVTAASLKRFERTGSIAFDSLVRLAIALDARDGFDLLFAKPVFQNLDDVLEQKPKRQRGRRTRKPR